jgi:SAM-dependent methyltransferase
VTSVFGVMFAPDQEKAAGEMLRVCRPGGRIVMANWMPEAFGGDFFGAHARHAPPPAGAPSPLRWGTEAGVRELLGAGTREIRCDRRANYAYYRSVEHALELFQSYFGPTIRALKIVGEEGAEELRRDLSGVFKKYNNADDGTLVVKTEYLQTVATRA